MWLQQVITKKRYTTDTKEKMNAKRTVLQVTLLFTGMTGLWCLDVSVTANNGGMILFNGYNTVKPALMYHAGLYTTLFSAWGMAVNALTAQEPPATDKPQPQPTSKN